MWSRHSKRCAIFVSSRSEPSGARQYENGDKATCIKGPKLSLKARNIAIKIIRPRCGQVERESAMFRVDAQHRKIVRRVTHWIRRRCPGEINRRGGGIEGSLRAAIVDPGRAALAERSQCPVRVIRLRAFENSVFSQVIRLGDLVCA